MIYTVKVIHTVTKEGEVTIEARTPEEAESIAALTHTPADITCLRQTNDMSYKAVPFNTPAREPANEAAPVPFLDNAWVNWYKSKPY